MSKDLPFFRFYVNEWLNDDISLEPYSTQGVFASVCALYWFQDCSVARAKLEQRFRSVKEELKQLYDAGIIKIDDDDQIRIKFLDEQYDKLSEKRKKRVQAGRKGGLAKSSKAKAELKQSHKQSSAYKDKDKDKDKDNTTYSGAEQNDRSSDFPDACKYLEEAEYVANYLIDAILDFDSSHKYAKNPPSLRSSILELERGIRLDGYEVEQYIYIIDFIWRRDTEISRFWRPNLQSGSQLREKFEQLKLQILEYARARKKTNRTEKLNDAIDALEGTT